MQRVKGWNRVDKVERQEGGAELRYRERQKEPGEGLLERRLMQRDKEGRVRKGP
jgi:hypothetical protein